MTLTNDNKSSNLRRNLRKPKGKVQGNLEPGFEARAMAQAARPGVTPPGLRQRFTRPQRQRTPESTMMNELQLQMMIGGQESNENDYYVPYHHEGDYQFSRDLPGAFTYLQEYTTNPETTVSGFTGRTKNMRHSYPDSPHRVCPDFMKDFGEICARQLNETTWHYEYKTFPSLCAMDDYNNQKAYWRYGYYVVYASACKYFNWYHWDSQPTRIWQILLTVSSLLAATPKKMTTRTPAPKATFTTLPPFQG